MAAIPSLALLLALGAPLVSAQSNNICYDRFGRAYRCSGLSNAARIGIGVAVAVAVLIIICIVAGMRRRSLQKNFARYRPPALPYAQNNGGGNMGPGGGPGYSYGQGNNPYANNPPPPMGYQGQQPSSWSSNNNAYGAGVSAPQATYQPDGARGDGKNVGAGAGAGAGVDGHEHGYEWEQAREAERLERMQQQGGAAPPGYDVSVGNQNPVVSGTSRPGNDGFAPPPGPPPNKA